MAAVGVQRRPQASVGAAWDEALAIAGRLYANRWFMGALMIVGLILYLWGANHAIDYPEYDESAYYARAYHLLHGDFSFADISNPGTSPLYVLYYAVWYLALRRPLLYPWVFPSGILLLGIAAYLLLSRLFHPTLAWMLALAAVIAATPVVTANGCYYFGAALLWLGLALLDQRVWMRALGVFVVLLSVFVRPDFLLCLGVLLVLLAWYEWRQWRRGQSDWRRVALAYAPGLLAIVFTLYLFAAVPAAENGRLTSAIPWSYNDYYNNVYPQQFQGLNSYADPWALFTKDFGAVKEPHSVGGILLVMAQHPQKSVPYLTYEATRLGAGFVASATLAYSWTFLPWFHNMDTEPNPQHTLWVALALLVLLALSGASFLWLRARGWLDQIQVRPTALPIIALIALLPQFAPLVLINPHQRYFMIFPLALALLGVGLAAIAAAIAVVLAARPSLSAWSLTGLILVMVALLPHPFLGDVAHPDAASIAFIQKYVPRGATIVGAPLNSFDNYLSTEGYHYNMMEAPLYADSVLVNAAETDPSLRYVLLTRSYPQSTYNQWFADWDVNFPGLRWTLVAQRTNPNLQLFALPRNAGVAQEIAYVTYLRRAAALHQDVSKLPPASALDLSANITWSSTNPHNVLKPQEQVAWDVHAAFIAMHPYYPGVDPQVAQKVWTTLPASWSGRKLFFLATLAPFSQGTPAQGVILTFSVAGVSTSVEVFNLTQQNWVPIVLTLPHYQGAATLTVSIAPRVSVNYCTTWVSFVGVTTR